jgi:hypothetical protein
MYNPSAIKNAITAGATWSSEECLVVGGVNKYPAVVDDAWVLHDEPGLLIRERVFDKIAAGVVQADNSIAVGDLFFAVAPVGGYCHLTDPS